MPQDPAEFLAGAVARPANTVPGSDPISAEEFLAPAAGPAPVPAPDQTFGGYLLRRALRGLAASGAAMAVANPTEAGLPYVPENKDQLDQINALTSIAQGPGANQALWGTTTEPKPPNQLARYVGALAEGATRDPVAVAAGPAAFVGSTLASEAGNALGLPRWGQVLLGLAGAGGAGLLQRGAESVLATKDLGKLAEEVAPEGLVHDITPQQTAAHAQSLIGNWVENEHPLQQSATWWPVDELMHPGAVAGKSGVPGGTLSSPGVPGMPGGPMVPARALGDTLTKLTSGGELGPAAGAKSVLANTVPARLLSVLQDAGVVDQGLRPAVQDMNWDQYRRLSSLFGEQISSPGAPASNISDAAAKAIYQAMLKDQRAAVLAQGGDAGLALFDKANAQSKALFEKRDLLQSLVEPGTSPEQALAKAFARTSGPRGGGSTLQTIRELVPDAADSLGAAALRTPQGWRRLAPEAQEALIPDPATRARVDYAVGRLLPEEDPSSARVREIRDMLMGVSGGHLAGMLANRLGLEVDPFAMDAVGSAAALGGDYLLRAMKGHPEAAVPLAVGGLVGAGNARAPSGQ